jgi:branched-chain amino acid transport system ATP-binding protein
MIEVENLCKYFGPIMAIDRVSFQVGQGEVVGFLGLNGAGKTTTMRSLMGLTPARQGKIEIFGQDTTRWPPYRIAQLGVGYVPEGRRVFANLTVAENLRVPAARSGPWTEERVYQLFPRLYERRGNRGRQLSGGEQEMLAIGRALILNPRLLILDEPSQGLAPLIVREVFDVVTRMRSEGTAVGVSRGRNFFAPEQLAE